MIDKLVDECTETVEEVKLAIITLAEDENIYKCSSCKMYTVLFWVFFLQLTLVESVLGLFIFTGI